MIPNPKHDACAPEKPVDRSARSDLAGLSHLPATLRYRLGEFLKNRAHGEQRLGRQDTRDGQPSERTRDGTSEMAEALRTSRKALLATAAFSMIVNILMLTGPLFMLQIYDRVITSGSIATLIVLTVLVTGLYGAIGLIELIRSRVIVRLGLEFDRRISPRVFTASLAHNLHRTSSAAPAVRDLDSLRQFLSGPGPITLFDAPWTPLYILVIFAMHWMLGLAAAVGAATLFAVAYLSETLARAPLIDAAHATNASLEVAQNGHRNAQALTAMGMIGGFRSIWLERHARALDSQRHAADRLGTMSALSRALRLLLQSLMLAIAAALAIAGEISAGTIVAAAIILGRALAPVEQVLGHWRGIVRARESYRALDHLLKTTPAPRARTSLPKPQGHLAINDLKVAAPTTGQIIISGVNLDLQPGKMLAVIGPSASGKSTLARAIVGLLPPVSGTITLDGAGLDQWEPEALGKHLGYLPQDVELCPGTVRDNIARFDPSANDQDVVAAARQAHAHDMILTLPDGYDTVLGPETGYLSAGQRQRLGLARALFGHPALVVLDEPNANLDRAGDVALTKAIEGMRSLNQAVVLISHRVQAIQHADLLLYLEAGTQRAFGTKAEIMKLFQTKDTALRTPQRRRTDPANAGPAYDSGEKL